MADGAAVGPGILYRPVEHDELHLPCIKMAVAELANSAQDILSVKMGPDANFCHGAQLWHLLYEYTYKQAVISEAYDKLLLGTKMVQQQPFL